jgi:hypothetical protein
VTARIIDGHLIDAPFLDEPRLRRLMLALNGDGEETRIVGGAAENTGRVTPWTLAVPTPSAPPGAVMPATT